MSQEKVLDFDYKGLDESIKHETILENFKLVENEIRTLYLDRLRTFNKEGLEKNPEPFRFLKEENCSLLIFILPYEFDLNQSVQTFIISTPGSRKEIVKVLDQSDLGNLDSYRRSYNFFREKILPTHGFNQSQIILETTDRYSYLSNELSLFDNPFNLDTYLISQGLKARIIDLIKNEVSQYKSVNETRLNYFAKDVHKFPFSLLDLKPLIEIVNDDDFSYQLDQAMAAYHENLFLPSAATLGVVLETLCIKILEENRIKVKTSETQLGVLKDRLMNEKITTRRDNARLEVAYKMRNLAAHSNPGVTLKEDCHIMLNVINTIAFDYLGDNQ